ncbi:MAG: hypothetical protein AMXMBFR84_29820 [Candidatus Hydrogenedentota bacterium]
MNRKLGLSMRAIGLAAATFLLAGASGNPPAPARPPAHGEDPADSITCANLIYAGSKSSVCFSDKFLATVAQETNVDADRGFTPVKLASEDVFNYPFAIMTGEGAFSLFEQERVNLKAYLTRGGFLLASAGCSSREWDQSFRKEFDRIFPDGELVKIPINHPIYHTVFEINQIYLKSGGSALLEGYEIDNRIVLVYSPEGLNDTGNVRGCCCCGGNEVKNSERVNTNIITYALTH